MGIEAGNNRWEREDLGGTKGELCMECDNLKVFSQYLLSGSNGLHLMHKEDSLMGMGATIICEYKNQHLKFS